MYTYLGLEELYQEGRELAWTATAFEGREAPPPARERYRAWLARVRGLVGDRAQPPSGWVSDPPTGREMASRAREVLELLRRLAGHPAG